MPACVVEERGDYTLHDWLSNRQRWDHDAEIGAPRPVEMGVTDASCAVALHWVTHQAADICGAPQKHGHGPLLGFWV